MKEQGVSYFRDFHYEVLSDWSANGQLVDPKTINWKAVAASKSLPTFRVRQQPGPWNSMGEMKFEMPNDFGIYLHDTPLKEKFAGDRWISNGCVRLEDYRRFAGWVFGRVPLKTSQPEQYLPLPKPVPIYLTYLTVAATPQWRDLPPGSLRVRRAGHAADVSAASEVRVDVLSPAVGSSEYAVDRQGFALSSAAPWSARTSSGRG